MTPLSINDIGKRLTIAGRLKARPLCVYGAETVPDGAVPAPSISSCVARAILRTAVRKRAPAIYLGEDALEDCCGGGVAMFGFRPFDPGIKYFVSYGSKTFRNGAAEYLRATPELVEENRKLMGKTTPPGRFVVIQACEDLEDKDPGVLSVLCFGVAEQIRNMCSLVQFRSHDPFAEVLLPQGASCASFVTYAAGMVERAPKEAVFVGPCDPTGNSWFPPDHLSLAIPIKIARRMCEDLDQSFIIMRSKVAYPERRIKVQHRES